MKKIILLLLLSLSLPAFSGVKDKEARKVLDATAASLSKAGGMKIKFTATSLVGKSVQGSVSGTMCIQGRKFQMKSPEMLTWFNGKTQWSLQPGDSEVSLVEPTDAELQAMNPYTFIGLYKRGFNYTLTKGKLSNGKQGYKIYLSADNSKQEIREIFLEVDQKYNPVRASIRQGRNNWTRIVINSFQKGLKFRDSDFTFPSKDYPKAHIIDLR